MGAALLVVPGIAAAYLWVAPRGRAVALRQLLAGGAALVVVGGAWPALIALTPADARPWVSGTSDNSIVSLIFGYNGLGRLGGQAGGPGGMGGGVVFGGEPGRAPAARREPRRPGRVAARVRAGRRRRIVGASRLRRADARSGWLIAVGGTFAVVAVAFSAAEGIFHPYYVSLLAPFTAALVGAGAAQLGRAAARRGCSRPPRWSPAWRPSWPCSNALPGAARGARARRRRAVVLAAADARRRRRARAAQGGAGRGARRAADRPGRLVGADARPRDERDVPCGRSRERRRSAGGRRAGGRMFGRDAG